MTKDEAIATVIAESSTGDVVVIHEACCAQRSSDERECTCQPIEHVVGAKA